MRTVHIVCGQEKPQNIHPNDTIFWWDNTAPACNEHSIPSYCKNNLPNLRQEFVEFIHNLGQSIVRGKPLYKWFSADDRLSMWWCSLIYEKHPQLMPEVYDILKLLSLTQMLKQFALNCTHIELHNANNQLYQCIKQYCSASKLHLGKEKHKVSLKLFAKKIVLIINSSPIFHIAKTQLRFVHWLLFVRLNVKYNKEIRPSKPCISMVSYFPTQSKVKVIDENFNTSDESKTQEALSSAHQKAKVKDEVFYTPYWGKLPKILTEAQKNINWLFIRISSPSMSFKQAASFVRELNNNKTGGVSFHFAEEFLSLSNIVKAYWRYMKICFISQVIKSRISYKCKLNNMHIWSFLRPYYVQSFQGWLCLERCLQRKAMLSYVAWAGAQECTLFPLENCPWERMLVEAIRHSNTGPVYGAQHSVIRAADFRYFDSPQLYNHADTKNFLPHKILVNGDAAYNSLINAGTPKHALMQVEALRYLHLAKYAQEPAQNKAKLQQIIIVTSFFPNLMQEHIKLLAKYLHNNPHNSWQIYIKAHPYCSVHKAVKKYKISEQDINITNKNIDELITQARAQNSIIWAAHDTTVVIEALYAGLPLIIQHAGNSLDFCPVLNIDKLKYVHTCEDVQNALEQASVLHFEEQFFNLDLSLIKWRNLLSI